MDSAIHRINHLVDKYSENQLRNPVDKDLSVGQLYPPFEQLGPGLQAEIMLSLLRLERKQKKNYSNPFRNRTFLFLSYLFGIETITTFIHSSSSLEKHSRFQTKMGKVYTRFRPKRRRNPTRWGGTYLYGSYKGVPTSEINREREPLRRRKS